MYVQRLHHETNFGAISDAAQQVISDVKWDYFNQISLKHRPNSADPFRDGVGSLYSKEVRKFTAEESEFSIWSLPETNPIVSAIKKLEASQNFTSGRVRLMRLMPKTGLSVHSDLEVRYHLVIKTNSKSFICWNKADDQEVLPVKAVCYHLPQDAHWYYADTRLVHWVYNGGDHERIHLVVCANK